MAESNYLHNLIYSIANSQKLHEIFSFLSSPELQKALFPAKIVFIFFSLAFFVGIIYFYIKSSYLPTHVFQDLSEFFLWKPYGFGKLTKRWKKIMTRIETGSESEYKLAIIEADDFLNETLRKRGYIGKSFEEQIQKVEKFQLSNKDEILENHKIRNSIVYDPDYKLDLEQAKKTLEVYQRTIQNIETF